VTGDRGHLAVHCDDSGASVDLGQGEGGQLAPAEPGVGRGAGHQLVQLPVPSGGQRLAEPGDVGGGGDLGRVDQQRGFPGHGDPGGRDAIAGAR
jgi:hypothetical protein